MTKTKALTKEVAELRAEIAELRALVTALQATQLRDSWSNLFGRSKPFELTRWRGTPTMGARHFVDPDDPYFNDSPEDWADDE